MLVTEEEAGKMICPVVDYMRLQGHGCRASGCMAWRWAESARITDHYTFDHPRKNRRGYCGLAGVPEEL